MRFLSTLSLRRATVHYDNYNLHCVDISIHALLAESDTQPKTQGLRVAHFYPRSPCGERLHADGVELIVETFLSTLSLRRATCWQIRGAAGGQYFYPRSPCGERHIWTRLSSPAGCISIHALLAESDVVTGGDIHIYDISIHALLAESDVLDQLPVSVHHNFYPRSPCGERLAVDGVVAVDHNFYPRSPCGERHINKTRSKRINRFLSTLSLRRATCYSFRHSAQSRHFYPRSPCGERPAFLYFVALKGRISIHALLAESDTR